MKYRNIAIIASTILAGGLVISACKTSETTPPGIAGRDSTQDQDVRGVARESQNTASDESQHTASPELSGEMPTVVITDSFAIPEGAVTSLPTPHREALTLDRRRALEPVSTPTSLPPAPPRSVAFDPSLGTVSAGDVWRVKDGPTADSPQYNEIDEQSFQSAAANISTFSLGVDTASYTNIRRYLNSGVLPPTDAVRIEEMVNYFAYDYPEPEEGVPFAVSMEMADCPWDLDQRLLRIGVRTPPIDRTDAPPANLVFLIDVSGSMSPQDRLPLIQKGFRDFVAELNENDRVSIVVYASEVGIRLDATPGNDTTTITNAMDALVAQGGTRGGEAIQTAYRVARDNFIEDGVNRIIIATDGDFNVGTTDIDELAEMVATEAEEGISMTLLGVGGNVNDALMNRISSQGNGTHHFLDTVSESRRVLVEQIGGTLFTVAEDFKSQVVFNPNLVESWRLVGYETRQLAASDFDDDSVKAGDIGAGLTTTILYQIVPKGIDSVTATMGGTEYEEGDETASEVILEQEGWGAEVARVALRYKNPGEDVSQLLEFNVVDSGNTLEQASEDFVFASAVASLGMLLRQSEYISLMNYETIEALASSSINGRPDREEFVTLVQAAAKLNP